MLTCPVCETEPVATAGSQLREWRCTCSRLTAIHGFFCFEAPFVTMCVLHDDLLSTLAPGCTLSHVGLEKFDRHAFVLRAIELARVSSVMDE